MRIVVVGATGNIGTALLRAAAGRKTVTSIDAVSRRGAGRLVVEGVPVRQHQLDLATPEGSSDRQAFAALALGADAVVHLARAEDRSAPRTSELNALLSAAVMQGAAGAKQLVLVPCASVYAPSYGMTPRREDWPATGVPGSALSADQVGLESMAARFQQAHPGVVLTLVRPALTLQESAGAVLARRFLGPLVPRTGLGESYPVLLWPEGLRLQVAHADDVAAVLLAAIERRAPGAYNVASPEVLDGEEVAAAIGARRLVELPRNVAEGVHSAAWWAHAVGAKPDLLGTLLAQPVLDCWRARELLGVVPVWEAAEVLRVAARGVAKRREGWTPALAR
ncbi:NAD-dependent epimerase/dehydratase family protein [Salana multivorans]